MKKHCFFLIALVLLNACTKKSLDIQVSDQALLIYHTQVIDVIDGSIAKDQAILLDKNLIVAIGDYKELKHYASEKNQIDAANKYVIPGLWDMHVHLEGADLIEDNAALLPVFVAYGITTVRDAASDLGEQVLAWRDEINQGELFGPKIFTAGRKLEGINSIWKDDLEIANEADLQQMLNKLEAYKVDFVKITENTLPAPLFLTSVIEAKKRGFKVSGHVPIQLSINQLADAGFSSIEHASYLLRMGSDEEKMIAQLKSGEITNGEANNDYLSNFDQEKAMEGYQALAKKKVSVTPTLIGGKQLAYLDENDHKTDDFLDFLSDRFTANYAWRIGRMANDTPAQKQQRKDRYQLIAKQLPYLQKAGINIMAGSDAAALNTFVYPALSLHEELVLFQDAGLTPLQILQSATINGAKFMGTLDAMSTISVGKMANLVILNSNPLEDIRATLDIESVINQGEYLNRSALDTVLEKAKQTKLALDQQRNK